jgi:hypothetical protein
MSTLNWATFCNWERTGEKAVENELIGDRFETPVIYVLV